VHFVLAPKLERHQLEDHREADADLAARCQADRQKGNKRGLADDCFEVDAGLHNEQVDRGAGTQRDADAGHQREADLLVGHAEAGADCHRQLAPGLDEEFDGHDYDDDSALDLEELKKFIHEVNRPADEATRLLKAQLRLLVL